MGIGAKRAAQPLIHIPSSACKLDRVPIKSNVATGRCGVCLATCYATDITSAHPKCSGCVPIGTRVVPARSALGNPAGTSELANASCAEIVPGRPATSAPRSVAKSLWVARRTTHVAWCCREYPSPIARLLKRRRRSTRGTLPAQCGNTTDPINGRC